MKLYSIVTGRQKAGQALTAMVQKGSEWCKKGEEHSRPNTVKFHAGDPPGVERDYVRDGNLPPRLHVVQALAEKKLEIFT